MRSPRSSVTQKPKLRITLSWQRLFDAMMLAAWSAVLIRYWRHQFFRLLLPPLYSYLLKAVAVMLAALALYQLWQALSQAITREPPSAGNAPKPVPTAVKGAMVILPSWLSSLLLLALAIFGLIYTPGPLATMGTPQTALPLLNSTQPQPYRRQPQWMAFLTKQLPTGLPKPDADTPRSLSDWASDLGRFPEPEAYTDQKVMVEGFVLYPSGWPEGYLMLARSRMPASVGLTYPVGLPVELSSGKTYPAGSWLQITGQLAEQKLANRRQVVIKPTKIRTIEQPPLPYEY